MPALRRRDFVSLLGGAAAKVASVICRDRGDHKLVFGWSLHWKVAWLRAHQDAINVAGRSAASAKRNYRLRGTGIDCRSRPCSNGNSTVPAIAIHCSLGTAAQWPSAFRQLPEPS